ncbi:MAG: hypothetical protein IT229_05050, partial [Flavobacteriales bacterium]|nr:hypothetical protein [Flavobacteriales bacterium]
MSKTGPQGIQAFITKWEVSGAAERANAQLFIAELCDVIGVEHPQPKTPDEHANAYVFEKAIPVNAQRPSSAPVPSTQWVDTPTTNFIDCYKSGCFVLETKQGADAVGGGAGADHGPPVSEQGAQRLKQRKTGHGIRGTKGWDTAMLKAREQAQRYARALPKEEI